MTDEPSRIARLEEQMDDVERWIAEHKDVGVDVALLKQCVKTNNGAVLEIRKNLQETHDTVMSWKGGIKVLAWLVGAIGILSVIQIFLGAFGL